LRFHGAGDRSDGGDAVGEFGGQAVSHDGAVDMPVAKTRLGSTLTTLAKSSRRAGGRKPRRQLVLHCVAAAVAAVPGQDIFRTAVPFGLVDGDKAGLVGVFVQVTEADHLLGIAGAAVEDQHNWERPGAVVGLGMCTR